MLPHPTHDRLVALGLTGMAKALEEQRRRMKEPHKTPQDIEAIHFGKLQVQQDQLQV